MLAELAPLRSFATPITNGGVAAVSTFSTTVSCSP
jgi:hypothetical protein